MPKQPPLDQSFYVKEMVGYLTEFMKRHPRAHIYRRDTLAIWQTCANDTHNRLRGAYREAIRQVGG